MNNSKFTDSEKESILKQEAEGLSVDEICRKAVISRGTYYDWKRKYAGLHPPAMRRVRQLEDENLKLRKLVAELALDREMLQDALTEGLEHNAYGRRRVNK